MRLGKIPFNEAIENTLVEGLVAGGLFGFGVLGVAIGIDGEIDAQAPFHLRVSRQSRQVAVTDLAHMLPDRFAHFFFGQTLVEGHSVLSRQRKLRRALARDAGTTGAIPATASSYEVHVGGGDGEGGGDLAHARVSGTVEKLGGSTPG